MFRSLRRHSVNSSRRGQSSVVTRLALVLLVWMGPVPVVHDHGNLAGSGINSRRFADHLTRFHAGIDRQHNGCCGWHVHWVLPGQEDSGLAGAAAPRTAASVAAGHSPTDEAFTQALGRADLADWPFASAGPSDLAGHFASPGSPLALPHFFSSFASRLSLPERLGILRC